MAAGWHSTIEGLALTQCTSEKVYTHSDQSATDFKWHVSVALALFDGICCVAGDPIARKEPQRCCSVWQLSHAMNLWQLLPALPCWSYLVYLTAKMPSSPQHAHPSRTVRELRCTDHCSRSSEIQSADIIARGMLSCSLSLGADWDWCMCRVSLIWQQS